MIKRVKLICLIGFLVLLSAYAARAETPKIATIALRVDTTQVQKLWFEALNLLNTNKLKEANLKLKDLDLRKVEAGLQNLPDHSAVLIKHANNLKAQGELSEAITLLESAKQLSPDLAAVHFALAKFRLALKVTDVYNVGHDLLHGVILKYQDVQTILIYANNWLSFVLVSGLITGTIVILFSFAYYRRAIFYALQEWLPIPFPSFMANIVGWVVLGALTLTLGIVWGMLGLAALLLISSLEPASKRALQLVFLFGSLIAGLLTVVGITFTAFQGNYLQALRDVFYGSYSNKTIKAFQQRLQAYPDDPYALFGLSYIAKNIGSHEEVMKAYELMPGSFPDPAAVQNNLGNLYQLQFRRTKDQAWYTKAVEAYNSAIASAPSLFEPRYNIGQVLLVQYQPENAQQQLETARKLNNERFMRYSGYLEHGISSVDASFSTRALLQKLVDRESWQAGMALAEELWASGSRFKNPWYFSAASFVLFVFSSLFGAKKGEQKKGIKYCQMCGDPYTVKRKRTEEEPSKLCTQCTSIFKKKTAVKPEKRAEKIKQIEFRQRIRGLIAKVVSFCIPGAGQIYFGYITKGFLFALVFSCALTLFWLKVYARIALSDVGSGSSSITLLLSLLGIVGAYLFNIYDILKLAPKNQ